MQEDKTSELLVKKFILTVKDRFFNIDYSHEGELFNCEQGYLDFDTTNTTELIKFIKEAISTLFFDAFKKEVERNIKKDSKITSFLKSDKEYKAYVSSPDLKEFLISYNVQDTTTNLRWIVSNNDLNNYSVFGKTLPFTLEKFQIKKAKNSSNKIEDN